MVDNLIHCCYLLKNSVTNETYIGVTSNFKKRMVRHSSGNNKLLKLAIQLDTWDVFSSTILFYGSKNYCYFMEPILIKYYKPYYNISKGGVLGGGCSGESIWNSKLTNSIVKELRFEYYKGNISQRNLATKYNVKQSTLWDALQGNTWRDAEGPIAKYVKPGSSKLDEKSVIEIRETYMNEKITLIKLGTRYNVSYGTISNIINGKVYKNFGGPIKGINYGRQ